MAKRLVERHLINEDQFSKIQIYRERRIFSLRSELLFLMYGGVLAFTTGAGMVIYNNIDAIGHIALLAILLCLIIGCYFLAFRKAKGFSKTESEFDNPVYDYLVLAGSLLTVVFFSYLQTRFNALGDGYNGAALASAIVAFGAAYYFDNRSSYAIGITSLAAFVGITATPEAVVRNEMYTHPAQTYAGLGLAIALAFWYEYCRKTRFKVHFNSVSVHFALHLTGIVCLKGLFEDLWPAFACILAAATYYFYLKSYETGSTTLFVFVMLYAYFGLNIFGGRFWELLDFPLLEFLAFVSPLYILASIYFFIKLTRNFNHNINDGEE